MVDNIDVLDGAGDTKTLATSETGGVHTPTHIVTEVTPGVDATDLGKAEDAAHASGHVGVMALGVRTDSTAARSGTDGDYEPLQIKGGRLSISALLEVGAAAIGKLAANAGVNIGDVRLSAGTAEIGKLAAGVASIGKVVLEAGAAAIGTVVVTAVTPPTALFNGQKTVTTPGTAEAIAATQAINGVTVEALSTNTNPVYVGNPGVSSANGYELAAGVAVFLEVDDLAKVFADVTVGGEGVSFLAS